MLAVPFMSFSHYKQLMPKILEKEEISEKETLEEAVNNLIKDFVESKETLYRWAEKHISELFSLRMKAFGLFIKEGINIEEALLKIKELIAEIRGKLVAKGNSILAENFFLGAELVTNVSLDILKKIYPQDVSEKEIEVMFDLSFKDYVAFVKFEDIPQKEKDYLIELTKAVTYFDLAFLITVAYAEGNIVLTEEKENELSLFLRDNAQLYGALAMELGLWKEKFKGFELEPEYTLPEEELKEEKELADMGLDDYLRNILKEENE